MMDDTDTDTHEEITLLNLSKLVCFKEDLTTLKDILKKLRSSGRVQERGRILG